MTPENVEGLPPGSGGPQGTAIAPADAKQEHSPVDRRTSISGLSVAICDVRIRLSLGDIWHALSPVSRHSEAAMLCIECEDTDGLEHHLSLVVDRVRKAAQKHKELKALRSEPGRELRQ